MFSPNPARVLLLLPALTLLAGCSRPAKTAEEVAGPSTPPTALRLGPPPAGGPSEAPTGGGAGGSAAAGYQFGRISSTLESPTLPPQPAGIDSSRMSPVGSSGSGNGDRGNPIPPDVSLLAPPDPAPPAARLAPGVNAKTLPAANRSVPPQKAASQRVPPGATVTGQIKGSLSR